MEPLDKILRRRLDALEQRLKADRSVAWQQQLNLEQLGIEPDMWELAWNSFLAGLQKEVNKELTRIQDARTRLDQMGALDPAEEDTVWQTYGEIVDKSHDIFRAWMEFLGGLAFREKVIDERICTVADQLINDCTVGISLSKPLTVPAQREARSRTLGRFVRVQFPEWNVWTLPFAAHEFGHVVEDESHDLRELSEDLAEQARARPGGQSRELSDSYRAEFLADAFATYATGPAYLFAGIMLRFDPSRPDRNDQPSDTKRAFLAFEMLSRMDQSAGALMNGFGRAVEYLKENWSAGLSLARRRETLTEDDEAWIRDLLDTIWNRFEGDFSLIRYQHREWAVAAEWGNQWLGQLKQDMELQLQPATFSKNSLVNVLNAAWLCRMGLEEQYQDQDKLRDKVKAAGSAALELCLEVVQERRGRTKTGKSGKRGRSQTGVAASGGG